MPRDAYPETVAECLVEGLKFKPEGLRAVREFRRSKPWRGTLQERIAKIGALNQALAAAYGIAAPRLQFVRIGATGGNGFYEPGTHTIGLVGKLSVVTYLHEFGHARGFGERGACRFSLNLFRRMFPASFARCEHVGHTLLQESN